MSRMMRTLSLNLRKTEEVYRRCRSCRNCFVRQSRSRRLPTGVNVRDEGDEVPRTAVGMGNVFFVEWLLEHGADPTVWPDREPREQNWHPDEVDLQLMDESFASQLFCSPGKAIYGGSFLLFFNSVQARNPTAICTISDSRGRIHRHRCICNPR